MIKNIEFPECWEEVQPAEFAYLLKLRMLLILTPRAVSLTDVKRLWCSYVLRHRGLKSKRKDYYLLVNRLAKTLDWQWRVDEDNNSIALTFDSTVNLIPSWSGFWGPASHGADLTFGEFRFAVIMHNEYTRTQDMAYLNSLCAILYRPKKNGRRIPFVSSDISRGVKDIAGMPDYLKWGIYCWFASFCSFLFHGTFVLDGCDVCFEPVFASAGKDHAPEQSLGMNSILFSMAESGVFGSIEEVDNTQLLRVLLKLLDDKQKADSLIQAAKKHDIQS
jgi:hypothetical protein